MNIIIIFIIIVILIFIGGCFGAPWIPTPKRDFKRIASLANLENGNVFYELGCGTGALLFYLIKNYDIKAVGIEISPVLFLYAKIKSLFYKNITIKFGNFFNLDLSESDIIYIFLMKNIYPKLKKKLEMNTKQDVKIILSCWPMDSWRIIKENQKEKEITYFLFKK